MDLRQTLPGGMVLEAREDGVIDRIHDGGLLSREQDVTEILRMNHFQRGEDRMQGFRFAPTFRQVARIPVAAAQGLDILNAPDDMRRFLNDPENAAFRTTMERV